MYKLNKISDRIYQIIGDVDGIVQITTEVIGGLEKMEYSYKYFDKNKRLIKISGYCTTWAMFHDKLKKELNND